jgi:hypothetical protein
MSFREDRRRKKRESDLHFTGNKFCHFYIYILIILLCIVIVYAVNWYRKQQMLLIYLSEIFSSFSLLFSEAHQPNVHLSRLIRTYQPTLTSKVTQPTASAPVTLPAPIRNFNRMSPSNRSKSPPKVARQADSSPVKVTRQADPSPKRSITNDTINTERLKLARDEADRAMKV